MDVWLGHFIAFITSCSFIDICEVYSFIFPSSDLNIPRGQDKFVFHQTVFSAPNGLFGT